MGFKPRRNKHRFVQVTLSVDLYEELLELLHQRKIQAAYDRTSASRMAGPPSGWEDPHIVKRHEKAVRLYKAVRRGV